MHWVDKLDTPLFYKYRPHLDYSDRDLGLLTNYEVWFDNGKNFNDPFDCYPKPTLRTREQAIDVLERTISGEGGQLSVEARAKLKAQYEADPEASIERIRHGSNTEEYVKKYMSSYSVFSLAKKPLNRLLWSHYASNHTGFAIEFDIHEIWKYEQATGIHESPEESFFPTPVTYQKERPGIHDKRDDGTPLPFFVKDKIWSYEEEYRILRDGQRGLVKYNPVALSAVVLGACVSQKTKSKIQDTIYELNKTRDRDVKIYYSELSRSSFDLQIPGHPYYENPS